MSKSTKDLYERILVAYSYVSDSVDFSILRLRVVLLLGIVFGKDEFRAPRSLCRKTTSTGLPLRHSPRFTLDSSYLYRFFSVDASPDQTTSVTPP